MAEYLIKNGFVFDPVQGIDGDKKDIAIKDGKIVEKVGSGAKEIDASGKTVMAGGVDIHSHVAGPKVNVGRIFRPEDKNLAPWDVARGVRRMAGGFSIPTTFRTGYKYAEMGYTTVMEAAMPPFFARHTHEEMRDTPILDQGAYPVFGNNWFVLEYLKNQEIENTAAYIAWLLRMSKGFAIKNVNPGGTEAWSWGLNCTTIHDPVPYFDITPAEIVKGLIEANEYLKLPHCMHVHSNNLGNPGNYETTLDTLKLASGYTAKNDFGRDQVLHHTHIQFHSYGGTSWGSFESKGTEVAEYVNSQKNISCDIGFVTLDETTTMTADGPFEHHLCELNHLKWANVDVELETGSGVVPYVYSPDIFVCGIQWATGLEIALAGKDMMRFHLTTDHPNAGPFTRYPRVMKWLMSTKARDEMFATMKNEDKVRDRTALGGMDRELTLSEIAMMTRAGPARVLGLSHMYGSLTPGLDGDVAVYDYNPDTASDPEAIETAFANAAFLFKQGELIINEGEIVSNGNKRTLWVDVKTNENAQVERDISLKFSKFYTMTKNNYEVSAEHYLANPYVIEIDATQ
ncbi:MAG: formylmethanofuran dehydrogenase subunit A [Methanocalculus sp. MSAO_Arc1]|uniref:formylmethanofuran dehydrogenase subunit A n=1 Tax=Methanocalculus TaxID=71151 RepID=UPI000FF3490B|nr:formylmethanofuran dehydrogenase subunit A [Methanocalculus sp. MSAO_Arc1]RQD79810.1 MAG: formylmethanofuran dehydrogenase subunit A [Methanocalculus sp. MSAO_Arc1]